MIRGGALGGGVRGVGTWLGLWGLFPPALFGGRLGDRVPVVGPSLVGESRVRDAEVFGVARGGLQKNRIGVGGRVECVVERESFRPMVAGLRQSTLCRIRSESSLAFQAAYFKQPDQGASHSVCDYILPVRLGSDDDARYFAVLEA